MTFRVAYLVNQYPKVSHTFIRREIMALERQGFEVQRIAVKGWADHLADKDDLQERGKTQYLLQNGVLGLLVASLRVMLSTPLRFLSGLALAVKMSKGADRPLPYHLAYLAEACVMLPQLKAFGARHLHAHFATNSTEVAMLAHALGGPSFSFTVHGTGEFDKIQQLGIDEKVRRAAFVVAICSHGRSQLFRFLDHTLWTKVQLVHCGLESAFHSVAPTPPPSTPRLVCVGRLCTEKGQLLLIEAAHRLAQEGIPFELVLAGDGEMRGALEGLISQYGLTQQIRITGWISSDQVRSEILASQALVLPSFSEGLPIVIMEAMALRRPVLTTFVGGIPELVQHGKNGWLFPAGSVDALAAAMRECFATTQPALEAMGSAAHERVLASHSIDVEVSKLAHLYKSTTDSISTP